MEFGSEKCYSSMVVLDQSILSSFPKFLHMFREKFGDQQLVGFVLKANISYFGI